MARTDIQQFRTALADGANQTALMRAYREIARRLTPAGGRVGSDWVAWAGAGNATGDPIPMG